jgi:hypothetical protein
MLAILSTYEEYDPAHDRYPSGQPWELTTAHYATAWEAVKAYLVQQQGWRELAHSQTKRVGLAPKGHAEPFAYFGDTVILNDAETITIHAQG